MTIAYIRAGLVRRLPTGFSWTTFFFGFIPSVLRGHAGFIGVAILFDFIGFCVSVFWCKGDDLFVSWISARTFIAAVRNEYLHTFYLSHGWRRGIPAQVIHMTPPANQ